MGLCYVDWWILCSDTSRRYLAFNGMGKQFNATVLCGRVDTVRLVICQLEGNLVPRIPTPHPPPLLPTPLPTDAVFHHQTSSQSFVIRLALFRASYSLQVSLILFMLVIFSTCWSHLSHASLILFKAVSYFTCQLILYIPDSYFTLQRHSLQASPIFHIPVSFFTYQSNLLHASLILFMPVSSPSHSLHVSLILYNLVSFC